jgi:hypothetical protein
MFKYAKCFSISLPHGLSVVLVRSREETAWRPRRVSRVPILPSPISSEITTVEWLLDNHLLPRISKRCLSYQYDIRQRLLISKPYLSTRPPAAPVAPSLSSLLHFLPFLHLRGPWNTPRRQLRTMYSSLPPTQSPFHSNFTRVIDPIPIPTLSANETTSPLRWFVVEVLNGEDTEDNINRWSSFIGIIIAISGNILISLALNIQKYAHVRLEREAERRRYGRLQTRSPQLDGGRSSSDLESFDVDEEEASEEEPLLARHLSGPKPVETNGAAHRNGVPNGKLKHLEEDDAEHLDANYIASPYWVGSAFT